MNRLVLPLVREFPVILVFFILIKDSLVEFFLPNDYGGWWPCLCVFSLWFLYAYLIAATVSICKRVWVRWLWYAILFTVFAVAFFIGANFDMRVSPTLTTLLVETNGREAGEFWHTFAFSAASVRTYVRVALLVIVALLIELGYRRYLLPKVRVGRLVQWAGSLTVVVLLALGLFRWSHYTDYFRLSVPDDADALDYPANDIYTRLVCSLCMEYKQSGVIERAVDVSLRAGDAVYAGETGDTLDIIVVIGESYIKAHAGIYGYPLPTTPRQQRLKDAGSLTAFSDVITPYNYTSMSLKNMLSCNSVTRAEKWFDQPYFPVLFKKAGYNVYFWDNQREMAEGSLYQYALNSYMYNKALMSAAYTAANEEIFKYDGQLVDDFIQAFDGRGVRNLVVFHLLGQHTVYAERFPHSPEFLRFGRADIRREADYLDDAKRQQIADYDNATLYNDYVLGSIIDFFADRSAVLVSLSDHGEEVYDYRDRMGRIFTEAADSTFIKYQYEIPFVVWCSDVFQRRHPDVFGRIKASADRPFMIDNVCQMLFHLGGIQTGYYHPERDVLSTGFAPEDRLIRGGEINYDRQRRQTLRSVALQEQ